MANARRCPRCRKGQLLLRHFAVTGDPYWICDRFPECSYWTEEDLEAEEGTGPDRRVRSAFRGAEPPR